jgi:hypothetical protein
VTFLHFRQRQQALVLHNSFIAHLLKKRKMSAIGELIVWTIYAILCIPPIITLMILREKKFRRKGPIFLTLALIPLTLFGYNQYSNHREAEWKYVGVYYLTEYPNCDACFLILNKNNFYSVINQDNEIEKGKWKYRSGGDYWTVDIGVNGQLGTGNFKYNRSEKKFPKHEK